MVDVIRTIASNPAGIYGSQGRADFTVDDVEHYFNYMGMLAVEGTYDRMEEMLSSGVCCQWCTEWFFTYVTTQTYVVSACCSQVTSRAQRV
jgi:hypothetical protein